MKKCYHKYLYILFFVFAICSCSRHIPNSIYSYYKINREFLDSRNLIIIEKIQENGDERFIKGYYCMNNKITFTYKYRLKVTSDTLFYTNKSKATIPIFIRDSSIICNSKAFFLPIDCSTKYMGKSNIQLGKDVIEVHQFSYEENAQDGNSMILFFDHNFKLIKANGNSFEIEKTDSLPKEYHEILQSAKNDK